MTAESLPHDTEHTPLDVRKRGPKAPFSQYTSRMRTAVSWVLWPLLAAASCVATAVGLHYGVEGSLIVAGVYLGLALVLTVLERVMPFEREWNRSDGQVAHDAVFTLIGSGLPGALAQAVVLAGTVGIAQWIADHAGGSPWPNHWPVAAQIALVVLVADFGAYWGHRAFHNVSWLWPFHAVHHSVPRLWWLNTGRIHPVDSATMIVFSMPLLFLLGVPDHMVVWLGIFTTFIGMLSHCNVEMRCGMLDWVFNTPGVHRWHHSRVLREGNNNYGEMTMVWDVVFGTHYRQRRRPPRDIGTDTPVPSGILAQFTEPLRMSWRVTGGRPAPSEDTKDPALAGVS
jgi:ornithine lipid hydroxylase